MKEIALKKKKYPGQSKHLEGETKKTSSCKRKGGGRSISFG